MLDSDISKGISGVVKTTGRVIASSLRGALMFGALAVAISAIITVAPTVFGAASFGAGVASLAGLFASKTLTIAAGYFLPAAAIGAITFGVTSLIPGISDGFGLKKLFGKTPDSTPSATLEPTLEPGMVPVKAPEPTIEMEEAAAKVSHVEALKASREMSSQAAGATR